ncbi:hypothetical protein [Pseudoxanthomonas sp. CF125]|uniref:hypothetical protein n=1 Tax=Pseudoxanthomonas sp. CF125 TaxID=1855303 RepID=UPI0008855058|nr:hypothetical protein [Pseudoxanthomonas sp. CF125]SDQ62978.1 hypothetical protein SAMN05216569_1882 [Pseudoxanthomonas sp. CF125]
MTCRPLALACVVLVLAACKQSAPAEPGADANPTASNMAAEKAAPPSLLSSPEDEVKASMDKFLKAKSFHAVMVMEGARGMTNEMDFVAPDRYRMKMPVGTQVIVGDTMYMQADGRSMKVPLPKGTLSQWRDPLKIEENKAGLSVEALGSDSVEGQAAKKYLVRNTQPEANEFTFWIGSDGLPLQLLHQGQAQGKPYSMTLRYSRFDDPSITIDPPQ